MPLFRGVIESDEWVYDSFSIFRLISPCLRDCSWSKRCVARTSKIFNGIHVDNISYNPFREVFTLGTRNLASSDMVGSLLVRRLLVDIG